MTITVRRPISAFIVCKNEAAVIGDCLDSLDFCREIVIVDSGSTDGTLALIETYKKRGFPIRLIEREWPGYAKQKQFALEQCSEPWCLNLDADERLDEKLKGALSTLSLDDAALSCFAMRGREYLPGYGYQPPAVHSKAYLRLVRKGTAHFNQTTLVHEALIGQGRIVTVPSGAILHFRNMSIRQEAAKASAYADLKAREQFARGRRTNPFKLVFKPLGRFLMSYIGHRNFLCGVPGLIYAAMFAQYSFLTEAKLYRLSLGADAADE
jgi:glycosyltransferase involved in cell wall biosynthesis